MKSLVVLVAVLSSLSIVECLSNDTKSYVINFYFMNPCGNLYSVTGFNSWQCHKHFYDPFKWEVEHLNYNCVPIRSKRQIMEIVMPIAKEIFSSATSFLLNHFKEGTVDRNSMVDETERLAVGIYNSTLSDYVELVSPSSHNHRALIKGFSARLPKKTFYEARVLSEIIGHIALLEQFNTVCKQGIVATHELSELTGIKWLSTIDPHNTILRNVITNMEHQTVVIEFDVFKPKQNQTKSDNTVANDFSKLLYEVNQNGQCEPKILWYVIIAYAILLTIISMIIAIFCNRNQVEQSDYSTVSGSTCSRPSISHPVPKPRNFRTSREIIERNVSSTNGSTNIDQRVKSFSQTDIKTLNQSRTTAEVLTELLNKVPLYDRE